MAVVDGVGGEPVTIVEDFRSMTGRMALQGAGGDIRTLSKTAEATSAEPATLYRGHALADVLASEADLLGREILARPGDPVYDEIARCLAPIGLMATWSFLGTATSPDKVGIEYGGRSVNFDPGILVDAVREIRDARGVLDGLVGGHLPIQRFVYPEASGDWTELVMFAPNRLDNDNPRVQPVWFRVCRVEAGVLVWARYFDSRAPFPVEPDDALIVPFYRDLIKLAARTDDSLAGSLVLDVPDSRLVDQAKHSLVVAMLTRIDDFPKYGVLDRLYGGGEHDGFQDTFTSDVTAAVEWGLFDLAGRYIDNYFSYFVRDDGSIVYRAAETGQYGRMLTVLAQYYRYSGDGEMLLRHRARIDAVADVLLELRRRSLDVAAGDPAHGILAGWCEADSCLEDHPERYLRPYLSNSAEAVRGFRDIGAVWEALAAERGDEALRSRGSLLVAESAAMLDDLVAAIDATMMESEGMRALPVIAGEREPFDVAVKRDAHDPQFRAYRANMELLFSGILDRSVVETIVAYREARHDIVLGVPTAYGYDADGKGGFHSGEMAGFLSYGHAFGLLQHDFVREFLLELYSLSAHQYTRGSWIAPETRRIDPDLPAAPYAVPAQLAVPMLVKWMVAFEDPLSRELWLCKATPRTWLAHGERISAHGIPTGSGRIDLDVVSELDDLRVRASVRFPSRFALEIALRLRVPGDRKIESVTIDGEPHLGFDAENETIRFTPADADAGRCEIVVAYAS
jgi:hypothetical protein